MQTPSFDDQGRRARRLLAELLDEVAHGQFPSADGSLTILPQPSERDAGVIALTGHAVVFADEDPGWIAGQLPPDDLSAPLSARFLHALGERLGRHGASIDMLTCADPLPGPPPAELGLAELEAAAGQTHPRIARALRHRDHVRAWEADRSVLILGQGVAGRWEVAVEVDPAHRSRGLGTRLAVAARHLVPDGAPLWAQIAPGNAASVRAFLRAEFRPVGAEALLSRRPPDATMAS
jgi:GNAT superfamily N-acetyltransferase